MIPLRDDRGPGSNLSPEELRRYARHLSLPEVGTTGQAKLKAGRVLAVGAGGLGSPLVLYLAAAGVGRIGLIDPDAVEASNLQRQVLYGTRDVGRPKVAAAAARLQEANPHVEVEAIPQRLTAANALAIVREYDVVADGTDNFPSRYLVNDACVLAGKPNVWASVHRFEGQASVFWAARGPCYRCLHPEPPPEGAVPSCAEAGVLGVLPGLLGMVQAVETIKLLLGAGDPLVGRLLLFDALAMRFREVRLRKNADCAVCGDRPTITKLTDIGIACEPEGPAASGMVSSGAMAGVAEISVEELQAMRGRGDSVVLLDVREPHEHAIS
ncbi:MAG: molybdopterin-synthase adenylyltransferase MoeB, partial [Acidobacteriota bacterium]|nr:molybdopterin-synthase adenylyltransferase MoeB [Acidobacteriota bacterium]